MRNFLFNRKLVIQHAEGADTLEAFEIKKNKKSYLHPCQNHIFLFNRNISDSASAKILKSLISTSLITSGTSLNIPQTPHSQFRFMNVHYEVVERAPSDLMLEAVRGMLRDVEGCRGMLRDVGGC